MKDLLHIVKIVLQCAVNAINFIVINVLKKINYLNQLIH